MTETPSRQNRFTAGNTVSKGRPRKAPSLDEMLVMAAPAILERTIEAALGRDMSAASIVLGMAGRKINR